MSDVIGAGSAGRLLNILVQKAHWAVLRCVCVGPGRNGEDYGPSGSI